MAFKKHKQTKSNNHTFTNWSKKCISMVMCAFSMGKRDRSRPVGYRSGHCLFTKIHFKLWI